MLSKLPLGRCDIRIDLFPYADARFGRAAKRFVEGFDAFIGADDLQINFHAAEQGQGALSMINEVCAQTLSAMCSAQ